MATVETKTRFTPEDLLALPDSKNFELVNGELVERHMGWNSSYIGGRLYHRVSSFCDANPIGKVAPADASYQCFADDPEKVRRPDVSFIRLDRLPPKSQREGHCRIAPDMATEVISPNELVYDVEEKVLEFLKAGVRLVWVIIPPSRTVHVHRANGTVTVLGEADELDGEDVIPGFRCKVSDLFAE